MKSFIVLEQIIFSGVEISYAKYFMEIKMNMEHNRTVSNTYKNLKSIKFRKKNTYMVKFRFPAMYDNL